MKKILAALPLLLWLMTKTSTATGPEEGLVLYLPFDSNTAATVGPEVGAIRVEGKPSFVEGRFGQALSLTEGARLVVPVPPAIKRGEFTIAFWMKPLWHPADNLPHPILEIPDDPSKADKVGWSPGQYLLSKGWSETIAPNNLYGAVSATAKRHLRPNQWTYVTIEYSLSGKFTATYFDGEGQRQPDPSTNPPVAYGNVMYLGKRASGYGAGDFLLDELKIFDRVVPPAELPAIAGTAFPPPLDEIMLGLGCDPAKAVKTPHVAWAKPLAGGPLRVLCVGNAERSREFIELSQRLEMELKVVATPPFGAGFAANPEVGQRIGRAVEQGLQAGQLDCVVIAAYGWNLLPDATRAAIMTFVRNGGGLLLIDPTCVSMKPAPGIACWYDGIWCGWVDTALGTEIEKQVSRLERADEEYLTQGIPFACLPAFRQVLRARPLASLFRGGTVGKGRILIYDLHLNSFALTPSLSSAVPFDTFTYDYAVGAAAKAVLWASGHDSTTRIQRVVYRIPNGIGDSVGIGAAGEWSINLWNGGTQTVVGEIKLSARENSAEPPDTAERAVELPPGLTRLALRQPMAAFGTVFGDVRLMVDGKVADWATGVVTVEQGNPAFVALTADAECYAAGQSPEISAEVEMRRWGVSVREGESGEIRWRLYDAYGRLVRRGVKPVLFDPHDGFSTQTAWKVGALDESSLAYTLVADLTYNGGVSDQRTLWLWRLAPELDDFTFFSWQGYEPSCNALATLVMRDRYHLLSGNASAWLRFTDEPFRVQLEWMVRHNLRPWLCPTTIGVNYQNHPPADMYGVRIPDLADPAYQRGLREYLAKFAKVARPFSPLFYTLGDETSLGPPNMQASSFEQDAFRRHLRQRYRTIKALNETWGTAYASWDKIIIPSAKEMSDGKGGALLAELEDFRETLYAQTLGSGLAGARHGDPAAHVGVEGIHGLGQAWTGVDYWKMTRNGNFLGLYDSSLMGTSALQYNMVRSFLKPGDLFSCWWNYEMQDPDYSRYGPWHALLHGMNAFGWFTTLGGAYSALDADFSPCEQFLWTYSELEPLLTGVGKLVLGLRRDDPGVAVLFEQRNLDRNAPPFHATLMLTTLLDDLGVQYNFMHGDEIAAGELRARKVKVLVLPGQTVMSPAVAKTIRAFVAAGGAVIADVPPASGNGFRPYNRPLLNDLFAAPVALKGGLPPASSADLASWRATHQRAYRRGRTLFFGGYFSAYGWDRLKPRGQFQRQVVKEFLAARGVQPAATVHAADGTFQPLTVVTYHDGDALYVGTQREYTVADQSPREFEVAAPLKAHVYDVRAGQYLGATNMVKMSLEVARGTLLAFLPYQAKSVELVGLAKTWHAGDVVRLTPTLVSEGGAPQRGVFRVEVTGPDGARVPALCSQPRWTGGKAALELHLAFNDPKGGWKIAVTDVATGVRTEQPFHME